MLKDYLNLNDQYVFTREPGGYGLHVCEKIRDVILHPDNKMSPITEAYLYAASRAEHVSYINKNLEAGKNVICERYYYSSIVYQGIARELGYELIMDINNQALQNTYPDMVFYIKIDIDTYKERRMKQKSLDRLEQENIDFFKNIIKGYDTVFNDLIIGPQIITIDGTKSPKEVHENIIKYFN